MAWIVDSLRSAIEAINPLRRGCEVGVFTHQLAIAAYMQSGLLRKTITIPADDRVREWREWQADKEQIEALEAEEKRLQLVAKVKFAEILRGIGGGALIIVMANDDHSNPLDPTAVARGALIAVNVVSRWQIQGMDWAQELSDPDYGCPRMFRIGAGRAQQDIHPSRVICFRGDPIPAGAAVSEEEAFWGDSRLLRVFREVQKSDNAHLWFSELVRKAKLLRIGIPDLDSMDQSRIDSRVGLIAEGENVLNATVYRSGGADGDVGETIDDYQVTWTGMPAMMDAFDQRVAAVADIPFTRLMGRSPAGMNATGKHDMDNWNKAVASGQNLEVRPCLEKLDPVMIRSAGLNPDEIWWRFAALDTPSEKEAADTFKVTMEAAEKLQATGAIPDEAFAKGLQNLMAEREWMPGLDQALEEIPEDQRYGISAEPDPDELDPSKLVAANENEVANLQKRGAITGDQANALLTDARPRTLYVSRKLINADEFIRWAKGQGFETTTPADELHVTICFSRAPVDWMKMGSDYWGAEKDGKMEIAPGGARIVEKLGDKGAAVLLFASSALSWRHEEMLRNGASFDFDEYQPHVTITYDGGDVDLEKVEPYRGKLVFGPEIFAEVVDDWEKTVKEA